MTANPLPAALLALLPAGLTVYDGDVPNSPTFPYVYAAVTIPEAGERAMTRDPLQRVPRLRTTVVGLTRDAVGKVAGRVTTALEGAHLEVPGWTGRVESVPNSQYIQEDRDVTVAGTGRHPLYAVLDWVAHASTIPN